MDKENFKKIIVLGIANSGKTAILNMIRDKNLDNVFNLRPTIRISRDMIQFHNTLYNVWDFSGVQSYLEWYLANPFLCYDANQAIFVVDINDSYFFDEFLHFFSMMVRNFVLDEWLLDDFNILILFHKADLGLHNYESFKYRIDQLEIPVPYKIFPTSLFCFKKKVLNSKGIEDLGSLIVKLFYYPKSMSHEKIEARKARCLKNYEKSLIMGLLKENTKRPIEKNKELRKIEKEFEKLRTLISDLKCPMCNISVNMSSLIRLWNNNNEHDDNLRKSLINLINPLGKSHFKIRLGIPCCSCFRKIFEG